MFTRVPMWAIVLGVLTSACAAPTGPEAATSSGGGPRPGGILNVRTLFDPFDWDVSYTGKSNAPLSGRAWDSLLGFKAGPDVGYSEYILRPELAERWEVSPDARTFTYHLRKGVRWASLPPINGRELAAGDVKWSYEYWARQGEFKKLPEGAFSQMFEGLEAVLTPDPYTVTVRFKEAYSPFLNYSASEYIPIVPHEIYDQDGHFKDRVVGTGPFQLDDAASQKGTRWVWKKNPSYWNSGKPYLDEVRDIILPDDSTAQAAFIAGRVDMLDEGIPVRDGEELLRKDPTADGRLYMEVGGRDLYMNPSRPPLNDVRVRKAINFAIDRDEFVKVQTGGKGGWALAGGTTFTQEEIKQIIPYNLEEARRLLREAGHFGGLEVQFEYPTDRGDKETREAELLQAQLKRAGINLVLKPMPYAQFSTMKKKKEHSMNLIQRNCLGDVDYCLYRVFHPKSKSAYDAVDDPKLILLLEAQRQEGDPVKRQQLVRDAVRYINVDLAVGRALYYPAYYQIWKSYVKNFGPHDGNRAFYVTESWLEK